MTRPPRFIIYCDKSGRWRWRLVAGNGRIVADSGQGYQNRVAAWSATMRLEEMLSAVVAPERLFG